MSHVIALEWFQDDDCDFPERALPSPPLASRGFWERQELSRVAPPGTQTVHMIGEVTYADGAELLTDEMYVVLLPEPEATLAGTALLGLALLRRCSRDRRWTGRAGVQKP